MKIINIFSIITLTIAGLLFTACDNDPHDPDIVLSGDISGLIPSGSVSLLCSVSSSQKHIKLTAEPQILFDMNLWGLKVDKVSYYIDNQLHATKTVAPFQFTYESDEWTVAAHTLRADISISGKGIETIVIPCTKSLNNTSSQSGAFDVYIDHNRVGPGEEFFVAAYFNAERSAPNTKITSFTATWDDVSFGTRTYAPYKLTKMVNDEAGSTHNVTAKITYTQGAQQKSYQWSFPAFSICEPNLVYPTFRLKSIYSDYENGDYLRGIARVYIGSEVEATFALELYIDDALVTETREFPYDFDYLLNGFAPGQHELTVQWVKYSLSGQRLYALSTKQSFTIIH